MIPKRLKRKVTDPYTGEKTYITTTEKTGRIAWRRSAEWETDKRRAIMARQRYDEVSDKLDRLTSIPTVVQHLCVDDSVQGKMGQHFLAIDYDNNLLYL